MALGTLEHQNPQAATGILAPKTWGDLQMFNVVIDRHFPFAREAALKRKGADTIREIQESIWIACCSEHDPTEELPEALQTEGTEMLKLMDIFEPEKVPTHIQRVTGAIAKVFMS